MPGFKSWFSRWIFPCLFLCIAVSSHSQSAPDQPFNGLKWRLIGPFRGGRAVAVAGVPGDLTTFYFGSVDGGIWKTTDAGVVWNPIFDDQNIASIGALAIAPSDPKTIYAGTGESDIRSNLASGNGVYKSNDAGRTWTHIGLEDTRQISRIVIDPQDANVIYVGALGHAFGPNEQRGVFKSMDGGAHWTKVLDQGPETGISDLALCSGNPQLLIAGTWRTRRPPWSTYGPVDGPGSGLFRSQDGGNTWSRLSGSGLPAGDWGRVGVDIASNGKRIYALIAAKKGGLFRSDDGGDSWVLENDDPRLTSRAWYFSRVTIDPQNPDVIYMPNIALYRSEDGGKTISVLRGAPGGDDYHQLWIDPKNSSSMILGTDQGTTVSLDRGQTWSSWYNQPTAQIYHLITDEQFPYTVYGTQQDSGAAAVPSRTDHSSITPRDWFTAGTTESGYLALDPNDSNILYMTEAYGKVDRFDRRTSLSQDISPAIVSFTGEINERKYRAPWSPVLLFSPADSKSLYLATQHVLKTTDGGLHWETISPDLTMRPSAPEDSKKLSEPATIKNARQKGYGVISTLAPSPLDKSLIWAGSDSGLLNLTRDGGKTWQNVTPPQLTDWSEIGLIEASHFDPGTAYATVDRSRLDDLTPYIYRTRDYGATWQLITQGISAPNFLRAVRQDPQTRGLLFAGTEFGVYVSFDDGDHWQSLQLNLPVTSIRDLAIHGDDLIAATHGRSFWILDDITPLRQRKEFEKAQAKKLILYRPAAAIRIDNDDFPGTPLPPEEPTAENPPNGAVIDYVLQSAATMVTLEILDDHGNLVRKFSSDDKSEVHHGPLPVAERWFQKPQVLAATPGMHRLCWDLRWISSGGPPQDDDTPLKNPAGPKVAPGNYQVRLIADGQTENQPLQVIMDPRSAASNAVLAEQQKMARQIFSETIAARSVLTEIESVKKQLTDMAKKTDAANQKLKTPVADALTAIDGILVNKQKDQSGNPGLQAAYTELASVLAIVEASDREIPSQTIAAHEESTTRVRAGVAAWATFKQDSLVRLNQALKDAHLTAIAIPN